MDTLNKACLYNRNEYQTIVTPILKEFNKFIAKNLSYFIKANYYGLVFMTYSEYKADQSERFKRNKLYNIDTDDYHRETWINQNGVAPIEAPHDIKEIYNKFISQFNIIFGNYVYHISSDENKSNKRSVRRAIDDNTYVDLLLSNELSTDRITEIFDSVGVKMSKRILELKEKIIRKSDNRELLALKTTGFYYNLKEVLLPLLNDIRESRKTTIIKIYDNSLNSKFDLYTFVTQNDLINFYDIIFKLKKSTNFDETLNLMLDEFVDDFITTFAYKVNEKLAEINITTELPELNVVYSKFKSGRFIGIVKVKYNNGFEFNISADVIHAGGYMVQCKHLRYIFNINYQGKSVSNSELNTLYKNHSGEKI